ncbi:hypothetical protein EST38_g9743 [Candolleomyces aberdarensis]|uniref:ribonuclease H n=1 Tax=Candolleomyces aberdarensis TaxID=2316362 RepID=A0A4Q2DAU7_9AGAR|nr:hypothetical protein EST38_g9743 [Candolleomyces aberdarensis]
MSQNEVPPLLHTQPIPERDRFPTTLSQFAAIPQNIADRNRRFHPEPPTATPADLFAVAKNKCSLPGYRFIRKTDRERSQALFFVDGSCLDNGAGPDAPREPRGGSAVVFSPEAWYKPIKHALELDGERHTSNRAELRAAIIALGLRFWTGEGFDNIIIATDSEYMVQGICERIHKWRGNGWRTSTGAAVKNRVLWEALLAKLREFEQNGCHVQFWLIPRAWNEADKYAKEAAATPDEERGTSGITESVMMIERMPE